MVNAISRFSLHWADVLVLVAYFAVVIGFGIWVCSFKQPVDPRSDFTEID
jgi:hypothetical protein